MIIWGGDLGQNGGVSGGRYDPASDTWSPTSTVNAPWPRRSHVVAWTGSEMIVWGGWDTVDYGVHDDGARYDPVADTWTPISVTGAPSRRIAASGVWTGSRLIVWGGTVSYGDDLRTGGRYDPATDTWTPTTLAGAPEGRSRLTAVWTGDRMIVWGGAAATLLSSGGEYFP